MDVATEAPAWVVVAALAAAACGGADGEASSGAAGAAPYPEGSGGITLAPVCSTEVTTRIWDVVTAVEPCFVGSVTVDHGTWVVNPAVGVPDDVIVRVAGALVAVPVPSCMEPGTSLVVRSQVDEESERLKALVIACHPWCIREDLVVDIDAGGTVTDARWATTQAGQETAVSCIMADVAAERFTCLASNLLVLKFDICDTCALCY